MTSLPNSIKEAMLQVGLDHAAVILELIFHLGYAPGERFTFDELWGQVFWQEIDTNKNLIRRGLRELDKHGLIAWRPIKGENLGRPIKQYQVATWFGIAFRLGVELKGNEHCDSPGEQGFSSVKNYRKGLFYTFIKNRPGKYSRRFLGQRLGVGRRTTVNYQKGTDIKVIFNWDDEELFDFSAKYAPKTRQQDKFFIKSYGSTSGDEKILPYTEFIVRREIRLGRRVFKTWQSTNEYQVA